MSSSSSSNSNSNNNNCSCCCCFCCVCGEPATQRCSRCRVVGFCGGTCARAAWPIHSAACSAARLPRPPNSAPRHKQTNQGISCSSETQRQVSAENPSQPAERGPKRVGHTLGRRQCVVCSKSAGFLCRTCRVVAFCSVHCAERAWPVHQQACSSPTTAATQERSTVRKSKASTTETTLPTRQSPLQLQQQRQQQQQLRPLNGAAKFFADPMVPLKLEHSAERGYFLTAKRAFAPGDIVLAADAYMLFPHDTQRSTAGGNRRLTNVSEQIQRASGIETSSDICSDDPNWSFIFKEVAAATADLEYDSVTDALKVAAEARAGGVAGNLASNESPFSCEHKDLIQLALAVLIRQQQDIPQHTESNVPGFRTPVSFAEVETLVSHEDTLRSLDRQRHWMAIQRTAKTLRRCATRCPSLVELCKAWHADLAKRGATCVNGSKLPSRTPDPASLLLRLKFNVFPVLDFATVSREVGVGCYPFASYFNHSCSRPNVVFHQLNGGRTIVFRATQRISVGEEASYSYLSSACVPFRERRRLLYDGFLIRLPNVAAATPRHRLDQDLTAPAQSIDAAQFKRVEHGVLQKLQHIQRLLSQPSTGKALEHLAKLRNSQLLRQLGPFHHLRLDVELASLKAATAVDDSALVIESTFKILDHLIHADSATGNVAAAGGLRAATLYVQNALAVRSLIELSRSGRALTNKQRALSRPDFIVRGFARAAQLLKVCLGLEHPFTGAIQNLLRVSRAKYS